MKTFYEMLQLMNEFNPRRRGRKDEITVVASDDETFDKYGGEIDFTVEVEWDPENGWDSEGLESYMSARVKAAAIDGRPVPVTPDLEALGLKKLNDGWDEYQVDVTDKWSRYQHMMMHDPPDEDG